jgi:hypothetical protein
MLCLCRVPRESIQPDVRRFGSYPRAQHGRSRGCCGLCPLLSVQSLKRNAPGGCSFRLSPRASASDHCSALGAHVRFFFLVPQRTLPDLQRMKLCGTVGEFVARSEQVSFFLVAHRRSRPTADETLLLCAVVGTEVGLYSPPDRCAGESVARSAQVSFLLGTEPIAPHWHIDGPFIYVGAHYVLPRALPIILALTQSSIRKRPGRLATSKFGPPVHS